MDPLVLTMHVAGLAFFILVIIGGIVDGILVFVRGTGSTISQFLITTAFRSPMFTFTFGCAMGHLFMYMYPMGCDSHFGERMVWAGAGAVVGIGIKEIVSAIIRDWRPPK